MSVHVLTLAAITAERVPGRKCLFHANLKHSLFFSGPVAGPSLLSPFQKLRDVAQLLRGRISREGLQENFTIGHPLNPAIEKHEYAAIGLCPNQPPKPLLQREHCL